jgi:hypothetical protein
MYCGRVIVGAAGQIASCSLLCLYFASTWKFKTRVGTLFLPARPEADEQRDGAQAQGHTVLNNNPIPLPTRPSVRTTKQASARGVGGKMYKKAREKKACKNECITG